LDPHDQHGQRCGTDDALGDASEEQPLESATAVTTQHDNIRALLLSHDQKGLVRSTADDETADRNVSRACQPNRFTKNALRMFTCIIAVCCAAKKHPPPLVGRQF